MLRRSKDPQIVIKASDILIARRADTKARADFPTWRMMAKLNAISSLSSEAQAFLADYEKRLKETTEAEATEATETDDDFVDSDEAVESEEEPD